MTVYEQIQKAVELIERRLTEDITATRIAQDVYMSVRSFHNYFFAVTGMSFREYVRRRRLSEASLALEKTETAILAIALNFGYRGHGQFTRAFKKEFQITPFQYRKSRPVLERTHKLNLYKELYMGVITKTLDRMNAVSFESYGEGCENNAIAAMQRWQKTQGSLEGCRIFGHNIDAEGRISYEPENEGYKVYLAAQQGISSQASNFVSIESGTFVVTGIEGNFNDDPEGHWIMSGWKRMNEMVSRKGYQVKKLGRWYEEHLIPEKEGNTRLDLYLEIERD